MVDWSKVKDIIRGGRRFAVTSHIYPDGDAVGSTIAFVHLLRGMGKRIVAINPSPIPPIYRFLDRGCDILVYNEECDRLLAESEALFILDSSSNDRLGPLYDVAERLGLRRVCIDHHPDNTVDAAVRIVDTRACSTAQLVHELYIELGMEIGRDAAEALYAAIHTDTVSFNFLGTDARTHEIAADLLRRGVDPKKAWTKIYGNNSLSHLKLAGITLSNLHTANGGWIAWLTVSRDQWRVLGIHPHETEAFTRFPLTLKGVGVIAVFCEEKRNRTRVSLRALDDTNVGRIARSFGGGGHRTSAGATVNAPLERVVKEVIESLKTARSRSE